MLPEMYIALRKTELLRLDADSEAVHVREDRPGTPAPRRLSRLGSRIGAVPAVVAAVIAAAVVPTGSLHMGPGREQRAWVD